MGRGGVDMRGRVLDKPESRAEAMINTATVLYEHKGMILDPSGAGYSEVTFARIKVAVDFNRLPPAVKLRAMVEGWDHRRIILELY
jgi:hypothetical protein